MFIVSTTMLRFLAATVWYAGSLALLFKGFDLIEEAAFLRPGHWGIWLAYGGGTGVGILKARFLFIKNGRKNLKRIDMLPQPRIWQFFRARFFIFLSLMILTGGVLSGAASGNYHFLIAVALLDFSIAIALFISGIVYFQR